MKLRSPPSVGLLEQEPGADLSIDDLGLEGRGLVRAPVLVLVEVELDPVAVADFQPLDIERERHDDRVARVDRADGPVALRADDLPNRDALAAEIGVLDANVVPIAELVLVGQAVHDVAGPAGAGGVVERQPATEVVDADPALRGRLNLDVPGDRVAAVDRHGELHVDREVRPGGVAPGPDVALEGVAGRIVDGEHVVGGADVFGGVIGDHRVVRERRDAAGGGVGSGTGEEERCEEHGGPSDCGQDGPR